MIVNKAHERVIIVSPYQGGNSKERIATVYDANGNATKSTIFDPDYKTVYTSVLSGEKKGNTYLRDNGNHVCIFEDVKNHKRTVIEQGKPPVTTSTQ